MGIAYCIKDHEKKHGRPTVPNDGANNKTLQELGIDLEQSWTADDLFKIVTTYAKEEKMAAEFLYMKAFTKLSEAQLVSSIFKVVNLVEGVADAIVAGFELAAEAAEWA